MSNSIILTNLIQKLLTPTVFYDRIVAELYDKIKGADMSIELLANMVVTRVYSVSTLYNSKNTATHRENRPSTAIVIKYEGETEYTSGGRTYNSNISNMVILPKGSAYEWRCTSSGHVTIIELESNLATAEIIPVPVSVKSAEKILSTIKELEYKRARGGVGVELESLSAVYSILARLTESAPRGYLSGEGRRIIEPALEYIALNYKERLTNDELASVAGVSTVYFRKLFREYIGTSPIDYIISLRIQKAKELLRTDYGTIAEVAQELGYQSIYDFSRAFKKYVGIAPSRYKK